MPHKDPIIRKQYLKDWRIKNREYTKQFDKKRYDSGVHGKECRKKSRDRNPGQHTANMRMHYYGVSKEWYDLKVLEQDNLCALCGKPETVLNYRTKKVYTLSVDHDHKTKKVRDLLCYRCNHGLGLFKEDIELLLRAAQYIKKHQE